MALMSENRRAATCFVQQYCNVEVFSSLPQVQEMNGPDRTGVPCISRGLT